MLGKKFVLPFHITNGALKGAVGLELGSGQRILAAGGGKGVFNKYEKEVKLLQSYIQFYLTIKLIFKTKGGNLWSKS